jgi:hypothetical protein
MQSINKNCSEKSKHGQDPLHYDCLKTKTGTFRSALRPEFRVERSKRTDCGPKSKAKLEPLRYDCIDGTSRPRAGVVKEKKCSERSKYAKDPQYRCNEETKYRYKLVKGLKKVRNDDIPKKTTGFFLWQAQYMSENPSIKTIRPITERAKTLGEIYRNSVSDADKEHYKQIATENNDRHKEYISEHPDASKSNIVKTVRRVSDKQSAALLAWRIFSKETNEKLKPKIPDAPKRRKEVSRLWKLSKDSPTSSSTWDEASTTSEAQSNWDEESIDQRQFISQPQPPRRPFRSSAWE